MSVTLKGIPVTLEFGEHLKANKQEVCTVETHDGCDWDTLVKQRLESLFPDMHVDLKSPKGSPIVKIVVGFNGRPITQRDVMLRLNEYFRHTPLLRVRSLKFE